MQSEDLVKGGVAKTIAVNNFDDNNLPLVYYNGNKTVNKVEYCHTMGKIFTPKSLGDVTIGNTKYVFNGFDKATYNVTGLTRIYAQTTKEAI